MTEPADSFGERKCRKRNLTTKAADEPLLFGYSAHREGILYLFFWGFCDIMYGIILFLQIYEGTQGGRGVLTTFSKTDIGRKRKINQDYVYASAQPVGRLPDLFIVADGMGGHNAGDYASKNTVETIVKELEASKEEDDPKRILEEAIQKANQHIIQQARESSELNGMGTTVVAATCMNDELLVANVGDSRLYVMGDTIRQITVDHSLVEEMIRMGGLARSEARNHPKKNIITRAIGALDTVKVDFFDVKLKKGDIILLCSDGLTNMLEDEEIESILKRPESIQEKTEQLVDAANENGGKDNIAVILIEPFAES